MSSVTIKLNGEWGIIILLQMREHFLSLNTPLFHGHHLWQRKRVTLYLIFLIMQEMKHSSSFILGTTNNFFHKDKALL